MQQLTINHFVWFYDFLLISVSACFEELSNNAGPFPLFYNPVTAVVFLPFFPSEGRENTHLQCSWGLK